MLQPTIRWLLLESLLCCVARAAAIDLESFRQQLNNGATTTVEVKETNPQDWLEQCVHPFDVASNDGPPSNANAILLEQPSGLCMATVSCAYEFCGGPFLENYGPKASFYQSSAVAATNNNLVVLTDEELLEESSSSYTDMLNLPVAVVFPQSVKDVSTTIQLASTHNIGISVKTSGHSRTGASTKRNTLLLHLSKLPKPALPETYTNAITNCRTIPFMELKQRTAAAMACSLAMARNKQAVIRVGGGQTWDEVLRTVLAWNTDPRQSQGYHIVGASSGSVAAVGGWLASGGLGNGMREFGVGVDQVLHVEMVLPSGEHVRFGPSEWKAIETIFDFAPQTTRVVGFCNRGDLAVEGSWEWVECGEEVADFEDLWFAVRGGGGGTFGIVTAVYYQLHKKPGTYQRVNYSMGEEATAGMAPLFLEFLLRFLFQPSTVGVATSVSNSCNLASEDKAALSCFHGAGTEFVTAWKAFASNSSSPSMDLDIETASSFPEWDLQETTEFISRQNPLFGHIRDHPTTHLTYAMVNPILIPERIFYDQLEEFLELMTDCWSSPDCLEHPFTFDAMGGQILYSSDGKDAFPDHRRNGGIQMFVKDRMVRHRLLQLIYGVKDDEPYDGSYGDYDFPGILSHNHLFHKGGTPQAYDWTTFCGDDDDESTCLSLQEASMGTANVRRLERIHLDVDPLRLFQTIDGVGYYEEPTTTPSYDSWENDQEFSGSEDEMVSNDVNDDNIDSSKGTSIGFSSWLSTVLVVVVCEIYLLTCLG